MRKLLYIFIVLMMFAACDIHTSDNGDLDGYWQLRSVDTLSTGCSIPQIRYSADSFKLVLLA